MAPGIPIEPGTEARPAGLPQGDEIADMSSGYEPGSTQTVHPHRLGTNVGDNYRS
jgi:hypothetical protein